MSNLISYGFVLICFGAALFLLGILFALEQHSVFGGITSGFGYFFMFREILKE